MKKFDIEFIVGLFFIIGIACLAYLSISLGSLEFMGPKGYELNAVFSNSGGLKPGSSVMIAGVDVGTVRFVGLENYKAKVVMYINENTKIQEDAIAAVKTKGIIGEKFIEISPGGSDKIIEAGGILRETQPAIDVEELISNYVFGEL